MTSLGGTFRVALVGQPVRGVLMYELTLGVLAFKEQAERWQLLATPDEPFIDPPKVDLTAVDGVIGFLDRPHWPDALRAAGVVAVNVSSDVRDVPLPRVSTDNLATGRMGAEHLLERGYGQFGFVGTSGLYAQQIQEGFVDLIEQQAGRQCHIFDRDATAGEQRHPIDGWLEQLPKPVAVMAANDRMGRRVIERATSLGLRVPEDVAVLGTGNDPWLTRLASPAMSSVEQNLREVGFQAARMLDGLLNGEVHEQARWIPPLGVAMRESTDTIMTDDPVVGRALQYIRDHCHEGIGVEDVLDEVAVSRRTLELHLKRVVGRTPQQVIYHGQVDQARKMLVTTDAPMYQIASACGFDRPQRFNFVFKRETGMTPLEYRRRFGSQ